MLKIITQCPACGAALERVNSQLFCRNKQCDAQTAKKLEHFAKVLKIKGLGEKTIQKLGITELWEIYDFGESELADVLGEKIGTKLENEILNSMNADLSTILESFSIPLIGNTAAKKICSVVDSIWDINEETCKKAGLGDKATANLLLFLTEEQGLLNQLPFSYKTIKQTQNSISTGKTVVMTGKLTDYSSRDVAKKLLESYGFKVADSVSKNTNYLIDEEGVESTKRKKAESLNIPILTIKQLFKKENINHGIE